MAILDDMIVERGTKDLGISSQVLSKRFKTVDASKGLRAAEVVVVGHKVAVIAAKCYSDKRAGWIKETRSVAVNILKQSL